MFRVKCIGNDTNSYVCAKLCLLNQPHHIIVIIVHRQTILLYNLLQSLILLLLPLCYAVSGSHVLVSIGGSSYSHGTKLGQPFQSLVPDTQVHRKKTKISESSFENYSTPVQVFTTPAPLFYTSPGHQTSAKVFLTEAPSD